MATVNIYDMADTWNDAGTTFTAIKMDVTDTASASGSLLMDLQVGGTTYFRFAKDGYLGTFLSVGSQVFETFSSAANATARSGTRTAILQGVSDGGLALGSSNKISWFSGGPTLTSTGDTILTRKGPANLRLGAADAGTVVPQILSVQGGSGTNVAGANFTIQGSQSTGSAAGGSILFQVSPAGSAGSGQNTFETALTINSARQIIAETTSNSAPAFAFSGASATGLSARGAVGVLVSASTAVAEFTSAGELRVGGTSYFSWANTASTDPAAASDVRLYRDGAGQLALRNGANAQTFNIYNTFTDATNYERFSIIAQSGGAVQIGTNKGSVGGTARALELQTDGQTRLTIADSGSNLYFSGSTPAIRGNANGVLYILEASAISPGGGTGYLAAANGAIKIGTANNDTLLLIGGSTDARAMFGGTTSSFPAIKRSTTSLQARLADDSAFTNIQGKLTTDTAYTAGAPTPAGYLVVYDSTGTAYKIPAEAV